MRFATSFLTLAALASAATAVFDWGEMSNMSAKQVGDGTFYGQDADQDAKGACSFNENFANTMSTSAWTTGTMVTIALNHDQFNGGKGCGTCIMYRGVGGGVGVTPPSTTQVRKGEGGERESGASPLLSRCFFLFSICSLFSLSFSPPPPLSPARAPATNSGPWAS